MTEKRRRRAPDLLLDEQLCFALYTASRAMTGRYRTALSATGLTYSQYLVMLVLWEHDRADGDDHGISLKEVGERLRLDTGTLSPLVKRLEQNGLVTRTRFRADERVLHVACTQAGRDLYQRAVQAQAGVGAATGLSGAELTALRDTLTALTQQLTDEPSAFLAG